MGHYASEMGIGPSDEERLASKYAERAWSEIGHDAGFQEKGPIARIRVAILNALFEYAPNNDKVKEALELARMVSCSHTAHYCNEYSAERKEPDAWNLPLTAITKLQTALMKIDGATDASKWAAEQRKKIK